MGGGKGERYNLHFPLSERKERKEVQIPSQSRGVWHRINGIWEGKFLPSEKKRGEEEGKGTEINLPEPPRRKGIARCAIIEGE